MAETDAGTRPQQVEIDPVHVMMRHLAVFCLDLPGRLGSTSNLSTHTPPSVAPWRSYDYSPSLSEA